VQRVVSPPSIRLVEGSGAEVGVPPPSKTSFGRLSLQVIPIVVALASTSLLAYFLLKGEGSSPQAQIQQAPPAQQLAEQTTPPMPQKAAAPQADAQGDYQVVQVGEQPPVSGAAEPLAASVAPTMPTDDVLLMLIQSYLIAVNQANLTGNYTVLRDLAAPGFQQANSVEKLAEIFVRIRNAKVDISPILLYQPKLFRKPEFTEKGRLRVSGFFPTEPQRVNFDLILEFVGGKWRLYGISAGMSQPKQAQPSATSVGPAVEPAPEQPAVTAVTVPSQAAPQPESSEPLEVPSVTTVTVTPQVPPKPASPGSAPKPAPKPKPKTTEASETAPKPEVDVRDRIDNPPAPAEKPKEKEKSFWNPFSR
jgi:hypothetical protein